MCRVALDRVARLGCVVAVASGCAGSPVAAPAAPRPPPPAAAAAPAPAPAIAGVLSSYDVPAQCPEPADYVRQVEQRLSWVRLVVGLAASGEAFEARVALRRDAGGWAGRLELLGFGAGEREVRGDRCQDVVAALALITVLRLEQARRERDAVSEPPPPDRAASAAPETSAEPASPGAPAPEPAPQPGRESLRAAAPRAAAPGAGAARRAAESRRDSESGSDTAPADAEQEIDAPAADASASREPSAGSTAPALAAALHAGYASVPGNALKLAARLELDWSATSTGWLLGLELAHARGGVSRRSGRAALRLSTLQLELCPVALRVGPSVWLRPCAHGRAGVLDLTVDSGDVPLAVLHDGMRPWAAAGLGLRAGLPLAGGWGLRTGIEASVQLVRDDFVVEPLPLGDAQPAAPFTLYHPELLSFEGFVGVAYAF